MTTDHGRIGAIGERSEGARGGEDAAGEALRRSLAGLGEEVGEADLPEAKVPQVTAHGMRGLHSTLALEHGASAHVVASSLGHESFSTTVAHYAKPEAIAGARQRRVLTVLDGGSFASSP